MDAFGDPAERDEISPFVQMLWNRATLWEHDVIEDLELREIERSFLCPELKWSCFLGQVCGLAKMHQVSVHAAFRVSALPKYSASGVRLSRAV